MELEAVKLQAQADGQTAARADAVVAAMMAALLGMFLLWGVGFSPLEALHDAAHDTRHSLAFPCH